MFFSVLTCSHKNPNKRKQFQDTKKVQKTFFKKNQKFSGYYASAQSWDGEGNYIEKLKDVGNTFWVGGHDIEAKLSQIRDLSLKGSKKFAIINLQMDFFEMKTATLKINYEEIWQAMVGKINPYIGYVAAFAAYDEPYWDASKKNMPVDVMKEQLEKVALLVHRTFPTIPMSVVFAYPNVNPNLKVPYGYQWVGFDCYESFESCGDVLNGYKSIEEYLLTLEALTDAQIFLVPQSFARGANVPNVEKQQEIINIGIKYLNLSKGHPRVIGFFPFIYNSSWMHTGAERMEKVSAAYKKMMNDFIQLR